MLQHFRYPGTRGYNDVCHSLIANQGDAFMIEHLAFPQRYSCLCDRRTKVKGSIPPHVDRQQQNYVPRMSACMVSLNFRL